MKYYEIAADFWGFMTSGTNLHPILPGSQCSMELGER
jgi:hypothetical protein